MDTKAGHVYICIAGFVCNGSDDKTREQMDTYHHIESLNSYRIPFSCVIRCWVWHSDSDLLCRTTLSLSKTGTGFYNVSFPTTFHASQIFNV